MTTSRYRRRSQRVSTWKKSAASRLVAWVRRNLRQEVSVSRGAGPRRPWARIRRVVPRPTRCPSPSRLDQPAVPGQQGRRGHDPVGADRAGQVAGQRGQDRPVWPGQPRPAVDLATQCRDLMAQGQQFREHDLVGPGRTQQGVEHANRDQIDQLESHDHDAALSSRRPSSQQVRQVLAPYKVAEAHRTAAPPPPVVDLATTRVQGGRSLPHEQRIPAGSVARTAGRLRAVGPDRWLVRGRAGRPRAPVPGGGEDGPGARLARAVPGPTADAEGLPGVRRSRRMIAAM